MPRAPGIRKHKRSGQAYVNFEGRGIYLGMFGSDESKDRYNHLKAEWLVNRHAEKFKLMENAGPFISDVCLSYSWITPRFTIRQPS